MDIDLLHLKMQLALTTTEKEINSKLSNGYFKKLTETKDRLATNRLFLLISVIFNIATVCIIFYFLGKVCI